MAATTAASAPSAISPLAKKLLLKPGYRAAIVNAPDGYAAKLQPLPERIELVDLGAVSAAGEQGPFDFVQVFARNAAEVERYLPAAQRAVKPDGLLWVCYLKGGAKAGTDIHRDTLFQLATKFGLTGVSLVAVDDAWSAMRFRPTARVGT